MAIWGVGVPYIMIITGEAYKLLSGLSRFHVQIQHTDYTKQRSIDTMTPNKLAVYFVADIVLLWPILFVADM